MIVMEICEDAANVFISYKYLLSQCSLVQGVYYELKIMYVWTIEHLKLLALAIPYPSSPLETVDIVFTLGNTPLYKCDLVA